MADVYKPHPCTEREALERLAEEARRGAHYLEKARLQIDASEWRRVTLWTIDQVGQATTPSDAVDLERGLPRLLVNRMIDSGRTAIPNDEYLLVGKQVQSRAVVDVLRRLEAFATPARVTRLQTPTRADLWLVHLLADERRSSGLIGLKRLGLFAGWNELSCHPADGLRVFLPAGISVPDDVFQAFCRLLLDDSAIQLLGLHAQGPDDERFYIVNRSDASPDGDQTPGRSLTSLEALTLPARAFVDSREVGRPLDVSVAVTTLSAAPTAEELFKDLGDHARRRGYRLRLTSTRAQRPAIDQLRELRTQQAHIEQRIAYLESIRKPRPTLLRFSRRALPALAHTIYSFAPDSLFGTPPLVRYAFDATTREETGFHYLLIEPDALRVSPDPLGLYDGTPPIKFWLDPSWGRHYHDEAGNRAYVFVPEHTALVPSLHAWMPKDMDEYLRRVLAKPWLEKRAASGASGDAYVYVLDRMSDNGDRLELTVLEQAAFVPLGSAVRWLTDNLTIADRVNVESLISDAATVVRGDALVRDAARAARASVSEFEQEATRTIKSFVDDLDRVLTAVHAGTAVVLKRADEAIDEMTRLDAEMYGLVDIPGRRRDVTELAQLMRQATGSAIQMTDALDDLERSVAATLERARAIESEERTQVEELLWSLKQTRQDLLRRLRGKRDQGTRR
jgi:hypothetical protein